MTTVRFTEFRRNASDLLTRVEKGETLMVTRHGRPIAEITPIAGAETGVPSWKRPGLRLAVKGVNLSSTIIKERGDENVL